MAILIYKRNSEKVPLNSRGIDFYIWKPGLFNPIPFFLGYKYFFWAFLHFFKFFKNRDYSAVYAKIDGQVVGFIVLTPAHFRWKFMNSVDLQITNVHIDPSFRKKGIASGLIQFGINQMARSHRTFWYITTEQNIPSVKLCEKLGFKFAGNGKKKDKVGIKGLQELELLPVE